MENLEAEIDRLYALDPGAFTAERDRLARELREAGRREDAAQVKSRGKPTLPPGRSINWLDKVDPNPRPRHQFTVLGIPRASNAALSGTRYRFVHFDLANSAGIDTTLAPAFEDLKERRPASVCLLNNAATVAGVDTLGRLRADEINSALAVNLAAAVALASLFCRCFNGTEMTRRVINAARDRAREHHSTSTRGGARLTRVEVMFEVAGRRYPLEERAATRIAENLRVKAAHQPGAEGAAGARPIADAIELRLIEDRDDPITLGGDGAEAVYYALNVPNGGSDQLRALYHAVKQLHDELGRKS